MDGVLLIGLPDRVARVVRSRLSELQLTTVDALPKDDTELAALAKAAVAIVGAGSWADWSQKIPAEARPPTYVVAASRVLTLVEHERYFSGGALGCVPEDSIEWVCEATIERIRQRSNAEESIAFQVGDLVSTAGLGTDDLPFVGWGAGPSGETFSQIRTLETSLRPLLDDGASPFVDVTVAEWLELYAGLRLGLKDLLGETQSEVLKKKVKDKLKKTPDDFCRLFEKTLVATRPVARPQALLVLGETGTGKSLIVKRLHRALKQKTGASKLPLYHVNCSTLGDIADVELFGAMRGAYTPLHYTNPGAILSSFGGTIFLDEFATLSPQTQAKLLLFLEDGTVKPMAWPGPALQVPVLVIAATNERLEDLVGRGNFRGDLFHRFRDGRINLPPLREAKMRDLPYLVDYLLQTDASNKAIEPKRAKSSPAAKKEDAFATTRRTLRVDAVGNGAVKALLEHDYPGNFRELQMALAQAVDRAVARRSTMLTEPDIAFGASTLQRQDSVVAIITRIAANRGIEVLLRLNPHWHNWFLPGGRVLPGESYEACLERELKEKLGLSVGIAGAAYTYGPVASHSEMKLIQYSSRDMKLKHYHFHPYLVEIPDLSIAQERWGRSVKWCSLAKLRSSASADTSLSETLSRCEALWRALEEDQKVTATA